MMRLLTAKLFFVLSMMMMMMEVSAFVVVVPPCLPTTLTTSSTSSSSSLNLFNKKEEEEDLSFIESRDMTREEMEKFNKASEDVMQAELIGMTIFSLIISIPMLYLVWVGFFSETAEMNL